MACPPPNSRSTACASPCPRSGATPPNAPPIRSTPKSTPIGWKGSDAMPHDHHDHDHTHDHDHGGLSPSGHPYRADNDAPLSYWQRMEIAVRELMIEKGHLTADQVAAQIDTMDARSPANGAAVVARAWTDPAFKGRLLDNASQACRDMGFDIGPLHLIAVENTPQTHNMIVCT